LFVQWPGFVITNSLTKQRIHVKQDVDIGDDQNSYILGIFKIATYQNSDKT